MGLQENIRKYFKLSDEEKDGVLVEIIKIYQDEVFRHKGTFSVKMLIDMDIERYTKEDEFELVQALTDIRTEINNIETEIRKANGL
jgi:hypothetical protein